MRVVVLGAGVFGLSAAEAFAARGDDVVVVDQGPLPHPLAESTDLSKAVRADYGDDALYTDLALRALDRFRGDPTFHETGVLFVTRGDMRPGGFEHDSFHMLRARGERPERLEGSAIAARFPAFRGFADGYFNPRGGWVEAGAWVVRLAARLRDRGVAFRTGACVVEIETRGGRATGARLDDGTQVSGDLVVAALGASQSRVLPWTQDLLSPRAQPVVHVSAPPGLVLPVYGADIAVSGFYGFPEHQGVLKIANHGPGLEVDPRSPGEPSDAELASFRAFCREHLPPLADLEIVRTRRCVYSDTRDQHFLIAPDPEREGLVHACGGSGHAFKMAPVLGDLVVDAAEGRGHPRFRFRDAAGAAGEERARAGNPRTGVV